MGGQDDGRLYFAPEAAAHGGAHGPEFIRIPAEHLGQKAGHRVRSLAGAEDLHFAVPPMGHHAQGFQVEVLLVAGFVFFAENPGRPLQGPVHPAALESLADKYVVLAKYGRRLKRHGFVQVKHRGDVLVFHLDVTAEAVDDFAVRPGHQADGLAHIVDPAVGEDGIVLCRQPGVELAGHVVLVHEHVAFGHFRLLDGDDFRPGPGGANHLCLKQTGELKLFQISGPAQAFGQGVGLCHRGADASPVLVGMVRHVENPLSGQGEGMNRPALPFSGFAGPLPLAAGKDAGKKARQVRDVVRAYAQSAPKTG